MSRPRLKKSQMDPRIVAALEESGLEWEMVHGKKHWKLYVEGRLVSVFSAGNSKLEHQRTMAPKTVAAIRRLSEELGR